MKEERKSKTSLMPAEIQKFKAILLAKRNEILGNMTCMEAETLHRQRSDLSNLPIHMADVGSDNYEIENTLGLMDNERKLISEIDAALERIEDETYGICEGNGEPIPKGRLDAIPWARYCVLCASMFEKGTFAREDFIDESEDSEHFDEEQDDDSYDESYNEEPY